MVKHLILLMLIFSNKAAAAFTEAASVHQPTGSAGHALTVSATDLGDSDTSSLAKPGGRGSVDSDGSSSSTGSADAVPLGGAGEDAHSKMSIAGIPFSEIDAEILRNVVLDDETRAGILARLHTDGSYRNMLIQGYCKKYNIATTDIYDTLPSTLKDSYVQALLPNPEVSSFLMFIFGDGQERNVASPKKIIDPNLSWAKLCAAIACEATFYSAADIWKLPNIIKSAARLYHTDIKDMDMATNLFEYAKTVIMGLELKDASAEIDEVNREMHSLGLSPIS